VNGVYGLCQEGCIKFFALGSVSRGVPRREWDIPFKDIDPRTFTFYPRANVVAIAGITYEQSVRKWKIQLNTLDDGKPHPSAQIPVLYCRFEPEFGSFDDLELHITSSRLAFLCVLYDIKITAQLVVWDWKTGEILLDLKNEPYRSVVFVDDFWLVTPFRDESEPLVPLCLSFLNTEQKRTDGKFTQTTFYFDPYLHKDLEIPGIASDLGGHEPSREDDLSAPFYPDPSQRVLVLGFLGNLCLLIVKVEALFELAQEREGEDIQWEEWQTHMTWVQCTRHTTGFGVSGHRLCCRYSTESGGVLMDVYDFGAGASDVRHTETTEGGAVWRVAPDITKALPWRVDDILISYGCHDSIAFLLNSRDGLGYTVHMWNFV